MRPKLAPLALAAGVAAVVGLVGFGLVARASQPMVEAPRLVSMEEAARAMQTAGAAMQAHGRQMLAESQRTGDQALTAQGEHWLSDGQALDQGGRWMAMNPTAPGSLVTSQRDLAAQGSWSELTRTAQGMLHDPKGAGAADLQALRWNGQAMRAEGKTMAEHGRVMAEEAEAMIARHALPGPAADELRRAARTMREVGGHLESNGQAMLDYAERLRWSMGYR